MERKWTRIILGLLLSGMILIQSFPAKAANISFNQKQVTLHIGQEKLLSIKNAKKKVGWKIISGKKCIKITQFKKNSVKILAKKKGTAKIQAKHGKQKLICKIIVNSIKDNKENQQNEGEKIDGKSAEEVKALKELIAAQRALGATVSEDINDGSQYEWGDAGVISGKLVGINWENKQLKGDLSVTAFDMLASLKVNNNQLTSLDCSNRKKLTYLYCQQNQLTSLSLGQTKKLNYLQCEQNLLTSLDLSACVNLQELLAGSNRFLAMDLSNCIKLKRAMLGNNTLSALDVSKNTELITLDCSLSSLTTLDVSNNVNLEVLMCSACPITELNVSNNTKLKELTCNPFINVIGIPSGCVRK